jgi:hypothetical protein
VERAPLDDVVQLTTATSGSPPASAKGRARAIVTDDYKAPAAEVRTVLAASRVSVSDPAAGAPKITPQGVVVNFTAQIEGYEGRQSIVRWSLFDARERTRMPQTWLRNRKALVLVPQAGFDRGSEAVFVLLPRERGPYFVRLELFDEDANRLAYADTQNFD